MNTLSLLKELVAIPSVYPGELQISKFIERYMRELGYSITLVETSPDRLNLVAWRRNAAKYVAFYGHMDTVPADPHFTCDPFTVICEGDIAKGLGVVDMKGGLTCILRLAHWAADKEYPIKFVFGVDEENISKGANDLVRSGALRDVVFMVAAESGGAEVAGQPFIVTYGRRGRSVISIDIAGKRAHAADAGRGVNAIEKAAEVVLALRKVEWPLHAKLGATQLIVEGIRAEAQGLSVPDSCNILYSVLSTPRVSSSVILDKVAEVIEDAGITPSVSIVQRETPYAEAFEVALNHPYIAALNRKIFGPRSIIPHYSPSVADENFFSLGLGIPVISVGPIGGGFHTANEWVSLRSMDEVLESYKEISQHISIGLND